MPQKQPPFEPPEGPHPFQPVLDQIAALLSFMEQNKNKSISEAPSWLLEELEHLEQKFERFRQSAISELPPVDIDEAKLKEIMHSLPEGYRQYIAKMIVKARTLKQRSAELRESWMNSRSSAPPARSDESEADLAEITGAEPKERPMGLLSKEHESDEETRRAAIQHRKKFGRMGGRKNWKPL